MRPSALHLFVLAIVLASISAQAQVRKATAAPPQKGVVKRDATPQPSDPTSNSGPTTVFTYQGKLSASGSPASGSHDFAFTLWDAVSGGTQQPQPSPVTVTRPGVVVSNGVFTVQLDFGPTAFPGADRFLEITVDGTPLSPRQPVTSTPYALHSLTAGGLQGTWTSNDPNNSGTDPVINVTGNYTINQSTAQQSNFKVNTDGGLVAAGVWDGGNSNTSGSTGGIPVEGGGARMMWYPRKAAFRAGYVGSYDLSNTGVLKSWWNDEFVGYFSTAIGTDTRAGGDNSFAAGKASQTLNPNTVAIGEGSLATGVNSFALGCGAHTNARQGSFVFADRSPNTVNGTPCAVYTANGVLDQNNTPFIRAGVNNSASWRVVGGFRIFTAIDSNNVVNAGVTIQSGAVTCNWGQSNAVICASNGAFLSTGGVWTNASSRALKENFAAVDSRSVLQKVLGLPIQTWNYKAEDAGTRHIGPMSQDFRKAFSFGNTDEAIATVDADGVALAAIQGLNAELKDQLKDRDAKIGQLQEQMRRQQTLLDGLKKLVCAQNPDADVCK